MASSLEPALVAIHYIYPPTVFLYFIFSSLVAVCTLQTLKTDTKTRPGRTIRRCILGVFASFLCTYLAQLIVIGSRAIAARQWPTEEHIVVGYLSSFLVFGIELIRLTDSEHLIWYPFYGSWILALLFEVAIAALMVAESVREPLFGYDNIDTVLIGLRCASVVVLVAGSCLWLLVRDTKSVPDEERQTLLPKTPVGANGQNGITGEPGYGTTDQSDENTPEYSWERREREARESMKKRLEEGGNWFEYTKGFMVRCPVTRLQALLIFVVPNPLAVAHRGTYLAHTEQY